MTDDPEPVEFKHWEINFATLTAAEKEHSGATSISGSAPQFDINYGALPETQLNLTIPFAYAAPRRQAGQYGIGDIQIGVKRRFIQETEHVPMLSTYPLVLFPTGDEKRGLGDGHVRTFFPLWLQKSWGSWTTYGGGGYWINPGTDNTNYWQLGWLVQRDITKTLTLGAEVFHFGKQTTLGRDETGYNIGGTINLSEEHHILLSAGSDISGDTRFAAYVGYQWAFGPKGGEKK